MPRKKAICTFGSKFKFPNIFLPNSASYWKKRRGSNFRKDSMKRVLFAVSLLMISMLACQMTGLSVTPQPTPALHTQMTAPVVPTQVDPAEMGTTLEALYEQVLPGVVAIKTTNSEGSGF